MIDIRRAEIGDSEILTNIAIRSEAYWGYDAAFMEKFKAIYRVTKEFINNNSTFVIQEDDAILGFYGVLIGDKETFLEYLFVEPTSIGKGYGKLLWEHMVDHCKQLGIKELVIVSGPQAKEFYVKMGAVPSGEVDSLVKEGRRVPRLIFTV